MNQIVLCIYSRERIAVTTSATKSSLKSYVNHEELHKLLGDIPQQPSRSVA